MIRTLRTYQVSERKAAEAKQVVKEFTEYVNAHWPEQKLQVFWQRFDVPTVTFYAMEDYEDLASLERWLKQPPDPDEDLLELYSRAADIFIEDAGGMVVLESV